MGDDSNFDNETELLLDHRAGRLEDLANNAIELIKINLLVLGLFTPLLSIFDDGVQRIGDVITSDLGIAGLVCWTLAMYLYILIFRKSRSSSVNQFFPFEEAVANNHDPDTLRRDVVDGKKEYEQLTENITDLMSLSVGFSLISILLLIFSLVNSTGEETVISNSAGLVLVSVIFVLVIGKGLFVILRKIFSTFSGVSASVRTRIEQALNILSRVPLPHSITIKILNFYIKMLFEDSYEIANQRDTPDKSLTENDLETVENLAEIVHDIHNISQLRAKALVALCHLYGKEPFKYSESKSATENTDFELTKSLIIRLRDAGYLQEITPARPFLLNDRTEEASFSMENEVKKEIANLVEYLKEDENARSVVAEELHIKEEHVENLIQRGDVNSRRNLLNDSISALEDAGIYPEEVGRLRLVQSSGRYRLTDKAINLVTDAKHELQNYERERKAHEAEKVGRWMVQEPPEDPQGTLSAAETSPGPDAEVICHLPDAEISEEEKEELVELENGDIVTLKLKDGFHGSTIIEEVR